MNIPKVTCITAARRVMNISKPVERQSANGGLAKVLNIATGRQPMDVLELGETQNKRAKIGKVLSITSGRRPDNALTSSGKQNEHVGPGVVLCINGEEPEKKAIKAARNPRGFINVFGLDIKISPDYAKMVYQKNLQLVPDDQALAVQQTHNDLFGMAELYDRYSHLMEAKG